MKQYKIIITLINSDELRAKVMARNQKDALKRLQQTDQYRDFVGNTDIVKIDIIPVEIHGIDNERFAVTNITNKPGWYVVCDLDHLIKIEFKKGFFNETQKIMPIGEGKELGALECATAMREISDYLFQNFRELL